MSNKTFLSKSVFQKLIIHLVNLEEDKSYILDDYFSGVSKERMEIENLLTSYIAKMDDFIANNIEVVNNADTDFPFVTIFSEVQLQDVKTFDTQNFFIVPPMQNKGDNDVSFLSPVGISLLLKNVGDEITIKTPGGKSTCQIKSIRFEPFLHKRN